MVRVKGYTRKAPSGSVAKSPARGGKSTGGKNRAGVKYGKSVKPSKPGAKYGKLPHQRLS
jgi:hypothetical protein